VNDHFLIARIISIFGKEGFVKISSFSDFPERFFKLSNVFIDFFGVKKEFFVEEVRQKKNFFVLKFKNFNSSEDVQILIGREIFVDKENVIQLPEGYFFVHDLVGSKVIRNNEKLGIITDVLSYPANDVYIVKNAGGREILLPAINDLILSFDSTKKVMILKPGGELYEDED